MICLSSVAVTYLCLEVVVETLLSVKEFARRLGGISPWTVHSWLSQGKLLRTKVGSRTMIRESELEKVTKDGEKSPRPRTSERSDRKKSENKKRAKAQ
jgi:Helix-turn-helix domain